MKKLLAISLLALILIFPNYLSAQNEFTLESISANIGKSSLSSGYDIVVAFKSDNATFGVTGNQSRVYARYQLTKVVPLVKLGVTAGFYKNAPWGGLQVAFQPTKYLSTLHWYGIVAGAPDAPAWKKNEFFNFHSVTVTIGTLDLTYAVMSFMGAKWNQYPEAKYTQEINNSWKCSVSAGYDVDNETPLYQMGLRYTVN